MSCGRVGLFVSLVIVSSAGCRAPWSMPSGAANTPFQPTAIANPTIGVKPIPRITVISPFVTPATQTEPSARNDNSANSLRIPTPPDPALQRVIEGAKQDLSKRLVLGVDQMELLQAQPVVWPNGSLGCPQPGLLYPQVELDGWLVRLRVNGRLYEYHSAVNGVPFLCET